MKGVLVHQSYYLTPIEYATKWRTENSVLASEEVDRQTGQDDPQTIKSMVEVFSIAVDNSSFKDVSL